jgi:hypothetical protein
MVPRLCGDKPGCPTTDLGHDKKKALYCFSRTTTDYSGKIKYADAKKTPAY